MGFESGFEQRKEADVTDVRWERVPELRSRQAGDSKVNGGRGSEGTGWGGDMEI